MTKAPRALRADGEATYNRILEAAGELIAASGFAATSSKAIAARAEVDLASINYHFRSRGGLYEAVLIEAHRRFINIEALQRIVATNDTARDKLRRIIEGLVTGATNHQDWHAKVLSREILSPSPHLRALERNEILPKLEIVFTILSEITAIPLGDLALRRCLISVGAPCAMLMVAGQSMPVIAEDVLRGPRDVLADHLYSFAIGGLEAVGRDYAKQQAKVRRRTRK
ncbi:MAG: TetR/AcrR family transcriptional regulator [Hyphomicrobiaceae bacterium]